MRCRAIALVALCLTTAGRAHADAQAAPAPAPAPAPAVAPRAVLESIASALGRDDIAAARAALEPALRDYADDAVLRNLAGVIEARRGETRAAQAHFEAAIRIEPGAPAAYVNLGRLLQERSGVDQAARGQALDVYGRLLTIDPQHAEALFQIARLQALHGRFAEAGQAIDRLPPVPAARPQVQALRAVVLAGRGDAATARATVDALAKHPQLAREDVEAVLPAMSLLPDDGIEHALLELLARREWATPAVLRRLGAIDASHHRYAEARLWLEKAATRSAPDVPLLMDLARFAFKAGDAKGALGYLAHARALEPANAAVHFLFGIVCVELNLGAEAHEALARAVLLDPGNPDVNYAMGAVSLHRHDPSEALPFFETYVRLRPQDPRGRFALGAAKYYCQRLDDARDDLAVAAADPVTAPGAHYYLARIARQQHDLGTARREIDAVLRVNPSHANGWAELGLIETRQGDYVAAEAALQKALQLDADNYDATLHLAALYGRTRDPRRVAQEARLQVLVARREVRAQEFLRVIEAVP